MCAMYVQSIGNRAAQHSHHEVLLLRERATKIPMMMAATARTARIMKKQIHRFLRAAHASTTALSVYCRLGKQLSGAMCWA